MKKLLLRTYWLTSSFFKKHYRILFFSVILGIVVFSQFSRLLSIIPAISVRSVGRIGTYKLSELPLDIQAKVSYGLTQIADDGRAQPHAANSLSVSDDGKSYTLQLDPATTWSTGEPLRSKDLQLEFTDVNVSYPNDSSIVFNLSEPFSPFPTVLSQPLLKKTISRWPFKKTSIIGLNDYVISDIVTRDQHIRSLTVTGPENKVRYHFYPTEADAVTAFKLGHIDSIESATAPYLSDWPNTQVDTLDQPNRYLAVFFNTKDPLLSDKSTRQLLTYATPKDNSKLRVISPINSHSWAYNPQVKPYDYSVEVAASLLSKLKAANADLALSLTLTTTPTYSAIAESIAATWQSIGIPTKVSIVPYPDINDYQVLLIGQEIPADPDQYSLWHSTQNTNITHYQNPKIDKLLEDGRQATDPEVRKQIYHDFQRFLVEDSPVAFLSQLPLYSLHRL